MNKIKTDLKRYSPRENYRYRVFRIYLINFNQSRFNVRPRSNQFLPSKFIFRRPLLPLPEGEVCLILNLHLNVSRSIPQSPDSRQRRLYYIEETADWTDSKHCLTSSPRIPIAPDPHDTRTKSCDAGNRDFRVVSQARAEKGTSHNGVTSDACQTNKWEKEKKRKREPMKLAVRT